MQNPPYKAVVNGQFEFPELTLEDLDLVTINEGHFHILKNGKSYLAELMESDHANKLFVIKINGNIYSIKMEDKYDHLVKQLGLSTHVVRKVKDIKAPMPGLVLGVNIRPGQEVHEGDALLILEAMKMENVIKSPGDGVVKSINVEKGMAVEKGFVLVEME